MIRVNQNGETEIALINIFRSINGEGYASGKPTVFIRTMGCNLRCVFCDTKECWTKENFKKIYPERDDFWWITAKDIFVSALVHDFCKTGFYGVEYRNTKDISGNWVKQPFYKTKSENRNLGHGNESVLMMLKVMPSMIDNRMVLEAVSRHMGFSDLSDSEKYNYSNFLENPLVVLLQLADQTAAQWFGC